MSVFFINPFLGAADGDYESIATVTVGSGGASSIEFTSIPGTYQHLQLRCIGRTNRSAAADGVKMTFNSDTGANYAWHDLGGNGSSAFAGGGGGASNIFLDEFTAANAASSIFAGATIDILDYGSTSKNKTTRGFVGNDRNGSGVIYLRSGLWRSTNAVTSIALVPNQGTSFVQHSTFALYGIKAP